MGMGDPSMAPSSVVDSTFLMMKLLLTFPGSTITVWVEPWDAQEFSRRMIPVVGSKGFVKS